MVDGPAAPFIHALLGAIFHIIGGLVIGLVGAVVGFFTFGLGFIVTIFAALFALAALLRAVMMYSPGTLRVGSLITLLVAVLSVPTIGGIFIGSILSFIGDGGTDKFCAKCGRVAA